MLTHKVAMLLALTGLSRAHESCYLDIRYLIKHSFGYTFHLNEITETARKGNLRQPMKYLNFNSNRN